MIPKIILIALALTLTFIAPAAIATQEQGPDGQQLNGMAPLNLPFTQQRAREVEARLTLPEQRTNKDWYANWVMIVGSAANSSHQIFVQVGIIRRPGIYEGAHAFVALQGINNASIVYSEWGALSEGEHISAIVERAAGFTMFVDGKRVDLPMPLPFAHAYVQVGPEVHAEGDQLVGEVRAVAVKANGSRTPVDGLRVCHYLNHGVQLVEANGIYRGHGTFDRKVPSRFAGDCAHISA